MALGSELFQILVYQLKVVLFGLLFEFSIAHL